MSIFWTCNIFYFFFFFKQKTAYEMRISDWSSDVCSSDLTFTPSEPTATRILATVPSSTASNSIVALTVSISASRSPEETVSPSFTRSDERPVGTDCVRTYRSRWSPFHENTIQPQYTPTNIAQTHAISIEYSTLVEE